MHHNVWLIFDVQKDTKRIHILSLLLPKIQKKEAYPKTRFPKRKGCEGGRSKRVSIDSRCNPSRYIHKAHWRAFIRASFRQTKNSLPPSPSPPTVFIAPLFTCTWMRKLPPVYRRRILILPPPSAKVNRAWTWTTDWTRRKSRRHFYLVWHSARREMNYRVLVRAKFPLFLFLLLFLSRYFCAPLFFPLFFFFLQSDRRCIKFPFRSLSFLHSREICE